MNKLTFSFVKALNERELENTEGDYLIAKKVVKGLSRFLSDKQVTAIVNQYWDRRFSA